MERGASAELQCRTGALGRHHLVSDEDVAVRHKDAALSCQLCGHLPLYVFDISCDSAAIAEWKKQLRRRAPISSIQPSALHRVNAARVRYCARSIGILPITSIAGAGLYGTSAVRADSGTSHF
jgi:hypothetical protein